MVYGFLLVGGFMMVSCLWAVKSYTGSNRDVIVTTTTKPTRPGRPGRPGRPRPHRPTKTTTVKINGTKPPLTLPFERNDLKGVVGDGWFSNDIFFGWEEGSYAGMEWGTGEKIPMPGMGGLSFLEDALGGIGSAFAVPPKLPSVSANWLEDLQKVFNQGGFNQGIEDQGGALGGWLLAESSTSTTTTDYPEYMFASDYNRIVVTASKDHLKPPRGGWGVDYNPYFYFYG